MVEGVTVNYMAIIVYMGLIKQASFNLNEQVRLDILIILVGYWS